MLESLIRGATSVFHSAITWTGVGFACYCLYKAIEALAGQTTNADIGVNLLADVKLSQVFAYLFGGGGIWYGWRQRSVRRDTIERLQARIRKLEQVNDPERTSSGLTPRGATHPKDKV